MPFPKITELDIAIDYYNKDYDYQTERGTICLKPYQLKYIQLFKQKHDALNEIRILKEQYKTNKDSNLSINEKQYNRLTFNSKLLELQLKLNNLEIELYNIRMKDFRSHNTANLLVSRVINQFLK